MRTGDYIRASARQHVEPRADDRGVAIVFGVSISTGIPGLISLGAERVSMFGMQARGFFGFSLTTPVAYACWIHAPAKRALEFGVCAPYLAYGRGHPMYGSRVSVFVPLVGGVAITRRGGVGGSCAFPIFPPFVRVGVSCFVFGPRIAKRVSGIFALIERVFS